MHGSLRWICSLAILGCVSSQGYYEEQRHSARPFTLDSIPKQFELRDLPTLNPGKEFERYADQIHQLAKNDNMTIIYKIQVETSKKPNRKNTKKFVRKMKAKKFLVPLKKNSMKLSNFEMFLRKAAEEINHHQPPGGLVNHMTSTDPPQQTTKMLHLKFKPIKSKLRNFSKIVRPVRNNIITLT